jgi:hypothetical protein
LPVLVQHLGALSWKRNGALLPQPASSPAL